MSQPKDVPMFLDNEEDINVGRENTELYDLQGNVVSAEDEKNSLSENTELIQRAIDGDKKAFSELYMQSYRYVFFVVRQYIFDDETVYDVIQETFIKVYKSIYRLNSPGAYYGWITAIAKNTARDFMRRSRFENLISYEENYSVFLKDEQTQKDVSLDIETVLKKMPPDEADLLSLVYYDGLRISQIAKMQGVPATTVYSRFNKAKKNLKVQLNARGIDKAIYSGNFVSMITIAIRNIIGTSILSVAIAQQILDSIINGKGKKEIAIAKILRAQQKKMILKIASAIVAISVATSAITALTLIDWSRFRFSSDDNNPTNTVTEYYYQNNLGGNVSVLEFNSSDRSEHFDSYNESQSDITSQGDNLINPPVNFYEDKENDKTTPTIINTFGNNPNNVMRTISGNMAIGGLVAKQGEWIYYVQSFTRLTKIKTDGSNKQIIYETSGFAGINNLNVIGDTIYYTSGGIWSMKTDGTERKQISSKIAYNLLVRGTTGWFVDVENTSETPAQYVRYDLYQIDLVTGEITTILKDGKGYGLKTVIGNSLIYVNDSTLYSYDISTGEQSAIKQFNFNSGINNMCVNGNLLYLSGNGLDPKVVEFDMNKLQVIQTMYDFVFVYNYFSFGRGAFYAKNKTPELTFYSLEGDKLCESNTNIREDMGVYTFEDGYAYYYDDGFSALYCCLPDGSVHIVY